MANDTRQQIYDRIRQSSKDEVILEEMKRLGFWPEQNGKPEGTEALIKRQGELERELRELMSKQRLYADPEQALKEMRKQRMADSKQRRIETKQRQLQAKFDRAIQWRARQQQEILYLGANVSTGLNNTQNNLTRLAKHQLPDIHSAQQLAVLMGIPLAELRFLAYAREVSKVTHYRRFTIAKKTGGERHISAPMPRLKRAQYWILDNILEKIALHDAAHGFRRGRSIVSNATHHVGTQLVMNCDLKNFFPTFQYARIKGVFRALGYCNQIASIFALLCSEAEIQELELDHEIFFVKSGERYLPQGAPTSPAITNIICRGLDKRLDGAAKALGYTYTRYADDLSFSGDRVTARKLGKLKYRLEKILDDEGLILHPDKTRIMRGNNRQEVTGIVVNQTLSLHRATLKRFRATLFQIEKEGPEGKTWGNSSNIFAAIKGYAHYVTMVNPEKGRPLLAQVENINKRYGKQTSTTTPSAMNISNFRLQAAKGLAPREPWWSPAEKPAPVLEQISENKPPVIDSPSPASQRTTRDIIREAVNEGDDGYQPTNRTITWTWWRRVKAGMWIALGVYLLMKLFAASPGLGLFIIAAIVYFVFALFRKR